MSFPSSGVVCFFERCSELRLTPRTSANRAIKPDGGSPCPMFFNTTNCKLSSDFPRSKRPGPDARLLPPRGNAWNPRLRGAFPKPRSQSCLLNTCRRRTSANSNQQFASNQATPNFSSQLDAGFFT